MTEYLQRKLSDSKAARWTVLCVVAFTMFCGYFITDIMAPLMEMLSAEFNWTASEYGLFNMAYGWLNVFLFMLIFSGMILDKFGVRITGIGACILMITGCAIKYYAISNTFAGTLFGVKMQVIIACVGFAIFALGIETAGITVTKVIVRWFKGHEMALAMGIQVAVARLGTGLAMATTIPMAKHFQSLSMPILIGLIALCIGLIAYLVFCVMDRKLDASIDANDEDKEEPFKAKDILSIINNKGFWLIALLCVLFYSAVFPFLKYATALMINKYEVKSSLAGLIPAILPFGTILLTPLFGGIYDKKGRGASIMMLGAALLIVVHFLFSLPLLNFWWFAAFLMILLGVAFSLVPSAMWPSVPKIIPENKVGTAYGLIFWVQNIGLSLVPLLIGWVLEKFCIIGTKVGENGKDVPVYDFTLPMIIFTCFGILSFFIAIMLKAEDKKKGYGLERPNMKE
ncbi:MFS transporter [Dysgonomonas sp. 520]|uniref:MFS transporter n=1 Tax=Dysgonomonas sp. 520 TaxID=2302931 RepID=UPI0013D0C5C5|nr:MFS transporter [Dysgonomonas sp. 520]NDW09413.1 MFS transporter [Dysgonomonas sp. 520]